MELSKSKELGLYVALAAVGCLALAVAAIGLVLPVPPQHMAKLKDLAVVAGDQNLIAQCEANITQTVNNNYGTVISPYKFVSQKVKGNDTVVTVYLHSTLYTGRLACSFHKSNWQISGVKPA